MCVLLNFQMIVLIYFLTSTSVHLKRKTQTKKQISHCSIRRARILEFVAVVSQMRALVRPLRTRRAWRRPAGALYPPDSSAFSPVAFLWPS